jgi:hypothetical protein
MPRSYRGSLYDSSDDEYPPGIAVITRSRHGSTTGRHGHHDDRIYVAGDLLSVPSEAGARHRSSSAGATPQPQFVNVVVGDRNPPERGHSYDRRRGRRSGSVSSEEEIRYREHHRKPSKKRNELDEDLILKLDKLKVLEKQEAAREHEEKLKKELEIQRARELYEREQTAKKEKELQKEYVEKWKREEAEKKEKEKREKEEEDRKFEERFKVQFMQAGYTEAQAEAVLQKKKSENEKKAKNVMAIDLSRPTWIKVKRKWLLPETLDHYYLPWEWDVSRAFSFSFSPLHSLVRVFVCFGLSGIADQRLQKDSEYIVIKQYVDQEMQDRLFEHTRLLKERRMIAGPVEKDVVTTLKVRDKTKNQMYLVRKASKSPGRKIYI